jgi:hypothetical protein
MPERKRMKTKGLYTVRLRMDHLVTFAHPNEKVVPLVHHSHGCQTNIHMLHTSMFNLDHYVNVFSVLF